MSNDMERERFETWLTRDLAKHNLAAELQRDTQGDYYSGATAEFWNVWQAARATPIEPPTEPPPGLLMSMAIRYDHGLGMPGYYDSLPIQLGPTHAQRLESTLRVMRQLWEEVVGRGFYRPEFAEDYVKAIAAAAPSAPSDQQGGRG